MAKPKDKKYIVKPMGFHQIVEKIIEGGQRYHPDAYGFVMEALNFTVRKLERPRHVTGQELSEGIRRYALNEFGPMARGVLGHWGIKTTEDFGEIVFNMIDAGLMGKTETDSKEDFKNVYDFKDAFGEENNVYCEGNSI